MNPRDLEQLSAYLDGQLSSPDLARIEARLGHEPELRQELEGLRGTRDLLRRLPTRRAPRNFTLTRQMVGRRPPVPTSFGVLRFASATAAFLLLMTFAINTVVPRIAGPAAAPIGMGGGGADSFGTEMNEEPALQAPAPAEPLASPAPEALRGLPPTAEPKLAQADSVTQPESAPQPVPVVPAGWQIGIAVAAAALGLIAAALRWAAAQRWRR